jgi:hypothetical protein
MTSVGRNDPCPCGSGKKYKQCCLRAHEVDDGLRIRLRTAEGALVPVLLTYAVQEFGEEFVDEAWDEFFLWTDVPDVGDSAEFGTTFDPFLVFAFVPDAAEEALPDGWPIEPLALHFMRHEVESAPDLHREFIEQACKSPASFFAVEAVTAGRSLDIKDIFTGRRFHVLEQSASRTLRTGDVLYTRVVTAGGGSIMIGACPWVIPASWQIPLINMRQKFRPKGPLAREDLFDYDLEIRHAYLEIADAIANPKPPTIRNTDGDPLELTSLTYELGVRPAEAVERLKPLATLRDQVHIADEVYDDAGALVSATVTWIKAGNRQHEDWDNTTLGTLRVDGTRLQVEINSARRRERIEKAIAKHLGQAATLVDTQITDLAKALAERRASGSSPADPPDVRTPELEALEAEMARRHWNAWIDTKIPALGNKTPRQAATTPLGRERLEALLVDYGQKGGRHGFAPDLVALRRKLGLA